MNELYEEYVSQMVLDVNMHHCYYTDDGDGCHDDYGGHDDNDCYDDYYDHSDHS